MNWVKVQEAAKNIGLGMAVRAWESRDARESAALYFTQSEIAAIAAMAYRAGYEDALRDAK